MVHKLEGGGSLRFAPEPYVNQVVGASMRLTRLLRLCESSSWYVSASIVHGRYLSTSSAMRLDFCLSEVENLQANRKYALNASNALYAPKLSTNFAKHARHIFVSYLYRVGVFADRLAYIRSSYQLQSRKIDRIT